MDICQLAALRGPMRYRTARLACTFLRRPWASGLLLSRSEATSFATALPQLGGPIPLPLSGRGSQSESCWGGGQQRHLSGGSPRFPAAVPAWLPPGACRGACRGSLVGNSGAGADGRAFAAESKVDQFDLIAVEEGLTRVDGCAAGRSMAFKGLHYSGGTSKLCTTPASVMVCFTACCTSHSNGGAQSSSPTQQSHRHCLVMPGHGRATLCCTRCAVEMHSRISSGMRQVKGNQVPFVCMDVYALATCV